MLDERAEGYLKVYQGLVERNHARGQPNTIKICHVLSDHSPAEAVLCFDDAITLDSTIFALRMALARYSADAVVFLTDTWLGLYDPDGTVFYAKPSQDPNRREAVQVVQQTRDDTRVLNVQYQRTEAGIVWGQKMDSRIDGETGLKVIGGRMMEWLKPVGKDELNFTQRRKIEPKASYFFNLLMDSRKPK